MKKFKNIFKYFLISIVWVTMLFTIYWIKLPTPKSNITLPTSTTAFIQITPKELIKGLLFDIYFKNKDIEIINALHSFMFSKKETNSEMFLEFDLSKPIYLVQCTIEKNPTWLLKGTPKEKPFTSKSTLFIYSKKTNELYSFLGPPFFIKNRSELQNTLFQDNLHLSISNAPLAVYSIQNRKIKESYIIESKNNIVSLKTSGTLIKERNVLIPKRESFHLTSQLNTNRLSPSYLKEYSLITNKLNGFSLNYYGAESNKKTDFLSLVPRFELLLNFKNTLTIDSLVKIITPHIPKEAIISPGKVELFYKNYYLEQVDSSTIYLSSNIYKKSKIKKSNHSFLLEGSPQYITKIRDLGIWETVLSFIPTYKSTDFFFNSIEKIVSNEKSSQPEIDIFFKKNTIPSIELLRLFLALNNPVEI